MSTEQTRIEPNWRLLPGTILDGGYEIEELLQADERRAKFKVRVLGDRTIDAFASFYLASGPAAHEQVAAWELLRRVPHPNVSKPLSAGRRAVAESEVVYVVLQRADETLDGALRERALTAEEAAEVLSHGARAIEHLGRHNLGHGCISPEEVLATGELIQLSAEGVQQQEGTAASLLVKAKYAAPESTNANTTSAAAIWSLGATVYETLTQKPFSRESQEQLEELPLGWILARCLDSDPSRRCKAEEIPALLKSGPPPRVIVPVAAAVIAPVVATVIVPDAEATPVRVLQEQEEVASAGNALGAAAGASIAAASAGASAPPLSTPAKPLAAEAPVRPNLSSVSQARTKAFKQAEFDALTAPPSVTNGGGNLRASASAGAAGAASASSFGATQGATVSRGSATGAPFGGVSASGARQAGPALPRSMPAEARRRPFGTEEPERENSRVWIYAAAGLVVLLLLLWALRSKPSKELNAGTAAGSPTAQNGAATSATRSPDKTPSDSTPSTSQAWPTRTLEPEKTAPAAIPAKLNSPKSAVPAARSPLAGKADAGAASGQVWRVVEYTFNRQEDAEKKAHAVNAKHPHLQAQVFSPNGHSGPYLVTLGGKMSHDDAARLRSRGLGSGMPRDSYIQNFRP